MGFRLKPRCYDPAPMGVSIGDRLGRFEILAALGAGGMGQVYRARDPQLQRDVAIKVLPAAWSGDPERQRRLEREARAAGVLNHPNIVAVHDVGIHDDSPFVVTELLEGETLRQRLNGRPLPAAKAVEYAIQIASGLAAGHERGVVHRDIKPENLFVTKDGRVKILDFGLARPADGGDDRDGTATITIDGPLGSVAGTPLYMSPEQARGLRADHRSDIFSFGTVLYEMLAGVQPFRRPTLADTLSAILNEEPKELSAFGVTPALERIVQHCLEKKPDDRFQSVRDLIFDLEALPHTASNRPAVSLRPHVMKRRVMPAVLAILALALAVGAGYFAGISRARRAAPDEDQTVRRLTDLPGVEEFPAISPDGRSVAFTASVNGTRQIFVRLVAGGAPLAITRDAHDHQQPRWTPDANALVYFSPAGPSDSQGAIWMVPALGGASRRIMASLSSADVSSRGRLACFSLVDRKVQLVTAALDGSDVRVLLPSSAGYHRYPRWSPDGEWIAFQRGDGVRNDVFAVRSSGGEAKRLTQDRNMIRGLAWLPDSSGLIYSSSRGNSIPYLPTLRLWEVRLDQDTPRPITPADVSYEEPDTHASGVTSAARTRIRFDIWKFPFDGSAQDNVRRGELVTRQTGEVLTPTASPDGNELAFLSDSGGHANLWVLSLSSRELRQITFESDPRAAVGVPLWSPDGRSIAFVSSKGRTGYDFGIWLVNPDGSNLRQVVPQGLGIAWSPDGRWLYYTDNATGLLNRIPASGGPPLAVRSERTRNVIGVHNATLYYMVERPLVDGRPDFELRAATPENGPSQMIARIPASRVAPWQIVNPSLSPDGAWLALPLTDGFTTNIWAVSTVDGSFRQVTDFGDRATFIARRMSWSADGKSIFAAIGEGDADIVLLDGLIRRR